MNGKGIYLPVARAGGIEWIEQVTVGAVTGSLTLQASAGSLAAASATSKVG